MAFDVWALKRILLGCTLSQPPDLLILKVSLIIRLESEEDFRTSISGITKVN
jgi:hypothetical protein